MSNAEKEEILKVMENLIDYLEKSKKPKRSIMLQKWLKSYAWYLKHEDDFSPMNLCKYPRGTIIKVNFGYRVNHEFGGVHYAVTLNKIQPQSDDLVTVVPLTSVKKNKDPSKLRSGEVYLGDEIYTKMMYKLRDRGIALKQSFDHISEIYNGIEQINNNLMTLIQFDYTKEAIPFNDPEWRKNFIQTAQNKEKYEAEFLNYKKVVEHEYEHSLKVSNEIEFMKSGSIALVNQIMTISKMRIRDPINTRCALSGIRLSNEGLDLIDSKMKELFTY